MIDKQQLEELRAALEAQRKDIIAEAIEKHTGQLSQQLQAFDPKSDRGVYDRMWALFEQMKAAKPGDRGERDRLYAIVITDMQKLIGFFETWILHEFDK